MSRLFKLFIVAFLGFGLITSDVLARGGGRGGGGRGGGGGMSRGGGGGMSRGGGGMPSMSRAAPRPQQRPQTQRPQTRPSVSAPSSRPSASRPNVSRPNVGTPTTRPGGSRPNISPPNTGGGNRPNVGGGNRPNAGAGTRPSIGGPPRQNITRPNVGSGRPSRGDLNDFLDLPGGRPSTLPSTRPGGDRPTTLPGGVNRPAPGTRPTPGERPNFDRPNFGNRPDIGTRPGVGDRPAVGERPRPGNRPAAGERPGVGDRPNRGDYDNIRSRWDNHDHRPFDQNWWGRYPSTLPAWHWHAGWGRYPNNWCWRHAAWPVLGTWFVWNWNQPVVYDYGTNVVYRDNYVYVDDQQVGTTAEYYQQAEAIADSVPSDVAEDQIEWMPLGVFAIAEQNGIDNGMLVQLAVSKEGIIAGTFYNDATDDGRPLEGMVDRETQRAAWRFADGKNTQVVMETSVYNLTKDETTALVHFGEEQTQTWLMVRLAEKNEAAE